MMAEDEELGRRCAAQSVSRKVVESRSRLGFTKVRTLYCVAFEASDRDEHVIEVAVRFALAGRSTLLTVDGEPVVKKSGRGRFEYGWARRGHAYVLREARAARPDDSDVFELLVDDKTYKNGRDAGAKGDLARTDSDDSNHGRGRERKGEPAEAKAPAVRHFTFNGSPKAAHPAPAPGAAPPSPAPEPKAAAAARHWRLNRPGEAKAISNRVEYAPKAAAKGDDDDEGDTYETRLSELIGAPDDGDDDDDAAADVRNFTRLVSSPTRREGGGFYSLLNEVRASEFV